GVVSAYFLAGSSVGILRLDGNVMYRLRRFRATKRDTTLGGLRNRNRRDIARFYPAAGHQRLSDWCRALPHALHTNLELCNGDLAIADQVLPEQRRVKLCVGEEPLSDEKLAKGHFRHGLVHVDGNLQFAGLENLRALQ